MACCLTVPSHYLTQCWLVISEVQRPSPGENVMIDVPTSNRWNELENHITLLKSPRGQWVKRTQDVIATRSVIPSHFVPVSINMTSRVPAINLFQSATLKGTQSNRNSWYMNIWNTYVCALMYVTAEMRHVWYWQNAMAHRLHEIIEHVEKNITLQREFNTAITQLSFTELYDHSVNLDTGFTLSGYIYIIYNICKTYWTSHFCVLHSIYILLLIPARQWKSRELILSHVIKMTYNFKRPMTWIQFAKIDGHTDKIILT